MSGASALTARSRRSGTSATGRCTNRPPHRRPCCRTASTLPTDRRRADVAQVTAPCSRPRGRALDFAAVFDTTVDWERRLVARIEAGDDAALGTIYDQYGALVHGIALRLVGSDTA